MNNPEFWKFFETDAYPNLAHRQHSLKYVFEHLDNLARPVFVVETGCVRNVGTWAEEGQSTPPVRPFCITTRSIQPGSR